MSGAYVKVARAEEVPVGGKTVVEVDDRILALFHLPDGFFALDDVCTHDDGPLSDGVMGENTIACPRHGAQFDIRTGKALTMRMVLTGQPIDASAALAAGIAVEVDEPESALARAVELATIIAAKPPLAVRLAKEAVLRTDLRTFRDVIDQYYADKGKYPSTLEALAEDGYLRSIPVDPMTKSADTWVAVFEEPKLDAPPPESEGEDSGPGIMDVHSGSDDVGSDGRPYSEW